MKKQKDRLKINKNVGILIALIITALSIAIITAFPRKTTQLPISDAISEINQAYIPPSINSSTQIPTDNTTIQVKKFIPEDKTFNDNALPIGTIAPDFTLYDLNNNPVTLKSVLDQGKPVMLLTGSYTCNVFRANVPDMMKLKNTFADQINMYLIYVVEPHPTIDQSPYAAQEWQMDDNIRDKVIYRQPTTYGERKQLAQTMLTNMPEIKIPLIVDDAENNFWTNYGQAPTRSYLLKPDGTIYTSQGWFSAFEMTASISALLTELKYEQKAI